MQKLKDFIKTDYKEYPLEFIMEAFAISVLITASSMFAFYTVDVNWVLAYSFFVFASAVLLFTSVRRGVIMWIVMNSVYLVINSIGLIKTIYE